MQVATIAELIAVGREAGHHHERLPHALAARTAPEHLALFLGVANWGVSWGSPYGPADPAGEGWEGQPARSGKHLMDGGSTAPYGGLGICHLDSGGLQDAYAAWGAPRVPRDVLAWDFNRILVSDYRAPWLRWADRVLSQDAFHAWLVGHWVAHFWAPCLDYAAGDAERAMVLSRVANSLGTGTAKALAGRDLDGIIDGYAAAKAKRSERAAARARHQGLYALRAVAVWRHRIAPVA